MIRPLLTIRDILLKLTWMLCCHISNLIALLTEILMTHIMYRIPKLTLFSRDRKRGGVRVTVSLQLIFLGKLNKWDGVCKHEIAILMTYINITMVDIHKKNRHTVFWIPLPSFAELGSNDAHVCTHVNIWHVYWKLRIRTCADVLFLCSIVTCIEMQLFISFLQLSFLKF